MANEDPWTEAIKEAMAVCPVDVVIIDTLEISHPSLPGGTIYLAAAREDFQATLETGETVTFEACAFRFTLPGSGDGGLQELSLSVDNVEQRVGDFLDEVQDSREAVEVYYRPFLSTDLSKPQMDPPLFLYWRDVKVTAFDVSGRCTVSDFINKRWPTQLYTRARFPGLSN